ncbi:hypothetical protein AVEN_87118-1 [Araneus ventricosus]|uniref:Uncharacterized protein n=1 Tax=Araneus ventricosus TaxID=182803 RepID=A0A4Y2HK20_ARAVE|nr:hypothetical protein AVEN_87118-1 [Araneus ventricosus]
MSIRFVYRDAESHKSLTENQLFTAEHNNLEREMNQLPVEWEPSSSQKLRRGIRPIESWSVRMRTASGYHGDNLTHRHTPAWSSLAFF